VDLLAYVRLSRETDVTNSPATQRLDIQEWADDHRHNIVGWAEDLDVSGKIPIMERDGAGPWFDPEKISLWQAICGKEVDRLFRDMRDFVNTARDLRDKHCKWIIDVSDGTDTSTTRGMEILEDRALRAERERTRMSERRTRAARRIRSQARWNGGLAPFGWIPQADDEGKKRLVHDPVHAPVLRRMVDDAIVGRSLNSIAAWLNIEGIPTPTDLTRQRNPKRKVRGTGWKPQSVRAVLRSRAVIGVITHQGKVVRGPDGLPQQFGEPIVEMATWDRLQLIVGRQDKDEPPRHVRTEGPRSSRLLLHVAYCLLCRRPLYGKSNTHAKYYCCPGTTPARGSAERCRAQQLRADFLEPLAEALFLHEVGKADIEERVLTTDDVQAAERARIGREISQLTKEYYEDGVQYPDFDSKLASLRSRHAQLAGAQLVQKPKWRKTGQTFAQAWEHKDVHGKRRLMQSAGFKIYVTMIDGKHAVAFEVDPDLARRAGLAASGRPAMVPVDLHDSHARRDAADWMEHLRQLLKPVRSDTAVITVGKEPRG